MSFELQGKIEVILDTQQVTERFKKREFVVATQDGAYTEQIKLQLTQDRCDLIDEFNEGDDVKVMFNLKGRAYTKNGNTSYFTNLDAWRIVPLNGGSAATPDSDVASPTSSSDPGPSASDNPGLSAADDDVLPF